MNDLIEKKWRACKIFYERNYRDKKGRYIRFKEMPSPENVNLLYNQMVKAQQYFKDFYFHHDSLYSRLQMKRGMAIDPTKKQKDHE